MNARRVLRGPQPPVKLRQLPDPFLKVLEGILGDVERALENRPGGLVLLS